MQHVQLHRICFELDSLVWYSYLVANACLFKGVDMQAQLLQVAG